MAVLLVDDLCGRVRVGDRVLATGSGRYYGGCSAAMAAGTHLPVTLGVQVGAGCVASLPAGMLVSVTAAGWAAHTALPRLPVNAQHLNRSCCLLPAACRWQPATWRFCGRQC